MRRLKTSRSSGIPISASWASAGVSEAKCSDSGGADVADPTAKQASFADQHNLKYPILSDADGAARKAYGVGKAFFGMAEGRETFFIDAKGIVRGVFVKNLGFQ